LIDVEKHECTQPYDVIGSGTEIYH